MFLSNQNIFGNILNKGLKSVLELSNGILGPQNLGCRTTSAPPPPICWWSLVTDESDNTQCSYPNSILVIAVRPDFHLEKKSSWSYFWSIVLNFFKIPWCKYRLKMLILSYREKLEYEGFPWSFSSVHVSQRMTFLYSPQLGNRSSRPVTKPTAMISKAWRPSGMPNLDRMIAPLRMRVDTVSYPRTCVVRPPKMALYKEAYWP